MDDGRWMREIPVFQLTITSRFILDIGTYKHYGVLMYKYQCITAEVFFILHTTILSVCRLRDHIIMLSSQILFCFKSLESFV